MALVIGPIAYLIPTAREKRVSELRQRAIMLGLKVKLSELPKLDPEPHERVSASGEVLEVRTPCVAYQQSLPADLLSEIDEIIFLRIPDQPTVPINEVMDGWALAPGQDEAWRVLQAVPDVSSAWHQWLNNLPPEVIAAGYDSRFIACYWLENAPADSPLVERINEALSDFRSILSELE